MIAPGTAALHPSERAARRAATRPASLRAWHRAARIALPIVALVAAAAAIFAALSAQAGMRLGSTPRPATHQAAPATPAPDAVLAVASPAQGTTGTAALPPEPAILPVPTSFDATITPARPFSLRGVPAIDRGRALECLTAAIYYEAASEPDDGQRAVAQVVLNRVRHPAFPASVCGVVYQGSERTSGCQFSYACDGAMARVPSRSGWARAARNAAAALGGFVFAPVGLATHYHTYAVTPTWNRTLVMTDAIGAHFFHRWKGYWGTAAAFHQAYAGREPLPGPHAKTVPAIVPLVPAPLIAAAATVPVIRPVTAPSDIQPAHRDSGAPIAAAPTAADAQILDRWKDSGKPLR